MVDLLVYTNHRMGDMYYNTTKRTSKGRGGNEARKHRLSTTRVNKMTTRWGGMEKQNSNEIRRELSV